MDDLSYLAESRHHIPLLYIINDKYIFFNRFEKIFQKQYSQNIIALIFRHG